MASAFRGLADTCCDGGRLEPIQRCLEALVIAQRDPAADEGENFIRCRRHQAGRSEALISGFNDLAGRPDQYVCVPDGRHAIFGHGFHADRYVACNEVDRASAWGFGEGEEGIGHEILRIAGREIAWNGAEQVKLSALGR